MLGVFQSRPLRLFYAVYDGPEVLVPDDDFTERFSRSRDPTDQQSPINHLSPLPVPPDVKPTVGLDIKPPLSVEDSTSNYFRSRNQTGCGRKRRRRRSSDEEIATEKRIKQEVTTDSRLHDSAGAPGQSSITSPMTSSTLSLSSRPRGPPSGATLSLPVTISKDFIKELVVSRSLEDRRRVGSSDSTVTDAASAATATHSSSVQTSQT